MSLLMLCFCIQILYRLLFHRSSVLILSSKEHLIMVWLYMFMLRRMSWLCASSFIFRVYGVFRLESDYSHHDFSWFSTDPSGSRQDSTCNQAITTSSHII